MACEIRQVRGHLGTKNAPEQIELEMVTYVYAYIIISYILYKYRYVLMWTNLIKRNIIAHHTPQAIEDSRESNLTRGIEVMWKLKCSSSKIKHSTPLLIESTTEQMFSHQLIIS